MSLEIGMKKHDGKDGNGNGAKVAGAGLRIRGQSLISKWEDYSAVASGTNLQMAGQVPIKLVKSDLQKVLRTAKTVEEVKTGLGME